MGPQTTCWEPASHGSPWKPLRDPQVPKPLWDPHGKAAQFKQGHPCQNLLKNGRVTMGTPRKTPNWSLKLQTPRNAHREATRFKQAQPHRNWLRHGRVTMGTPREPQGPPIGPQNSKPMGTHPERQHDSNKPSPIEIG